MSYEVKMAEVLTPAKCKDNPSALFVFSDNMERWGKKAQSIIRHEPNAIGIATKETPYMYLSDEAFDINKKTIDEDIAKIKERLNDYTMLVFPAAGLGGGLAKMHQVAPRTFLYLCGALLDEFEFNNLQNFTTRFKI